MTLPPPLLETKPMLINWMNCGAGMSVHALTSIISIGSEEDQRTGRRRRLTKPSARSAYAALRLLLNEGPRRTLPPSVTRPNPLGVEP